MKSLQFIEFLKNDDIRPDNLFEFVYQPLAIQDGKLCSPDELVVLLHSVEHQGHLQRGVLKWLVTQDRGHSYKTFFVMPHVSSDSPGYSGFNLLMCNMLGSCGFLVGTFELKEICYTLSKLRPKLPEIRGSEEVSFWRPIYFFANNYLYFAYLLFLSLLLFPIFYFHFFSFSPMLPLLLKSFPNKVFKFPGVT